tara:strand:- start:2479 stop:2823 length:345 start_codon:yes stop_codon:yes gene_type:complete
MLDNNVKSNSPKVMEQTSKVSMTLDKRTVERIRLIKKVSGKPEEMAINTEINKALLSVLDALESKKGLKKNSWKSAKVCPKCSGGTLVHKERRHDSKLFYACSNYPKCQHTENA